MSAADQRRIARELAELRALVNKLIRVGDYPTYFGDDGWLTIGSADQPQFQNGWTNYGSGWANAGYRSDLEGWIHLRGLIKNGTLNSVAFTLPPTHRPAFRVSCSTVANANIAVHVTVETNGEVKIQSSSTSWVALWNVRFPVWTMADLTYRPLDATNYTSEGTRRPFLVRRRTGMIEALGLGGAWPTTNRAPLGAAGPLRGSIYAGDGQLNGQRINVATGAMWPYANIASYVVLGGMSWPSQSIEPLFEDLPLTAPWVPHPPDTGNWATPSYFRDTEGIVHLRGLLQSGSNGQTVATLPVGFRPEVRSMFLVASATGDCRLDIEADGRIIPREGTSSAWTALDGVEFYSAPA